MTASLSVSEARASLPQILDRVGDGEEVTITRHGEPVAVILRPDKLRVRRAGPALDQASHIHEMVMSSATKPLPRRPRLSPAQADALVSEVRAGRASR